MDFGEGVKTERSLTYPAVGTVDFLDFAYNRIRLEDMNETAGFIRIDNNTGETLYPPVLFYQ